MIHPIITVTDTTIVSHFSNGASVYRGIPNGLRVQYYHADVWFFRAPPTRGMLRLMARREMDWIK